MRQLTAKFIAAIGILFAFSTSTFAIPVSYTFSADNFTAHFGTPIPTPSVVGSFTLDGLTLLDLSLTLGSHTYTLAETGAGHPPGPGVEIGGLLNGLNQINFGTDDFSMIFSPANPGGPLHPTFGYTVAGIQDGYIAGSVEVELAPIPEPGTLALVALAGIACTIARRKQSNQRA